MKKELTSRAIEMLKQDDDLFVTMVNVADSWNGFADGFRAFPMIELDELFCGVSISDFLQKLAHGFNFWDEYFIDTIYGLESTNDIVAHYRNNVDEGELLNELIVNFYSLDFCGYDDFEEIVRSIVDCE